MRKTPCVDPALESYDLGHFRGPAGSAAFVAPFVNDKTIEGWIVIDAIGHAEQADLVAVIRDSETITVTSDASDYTAAAGDLAARGERVVLLEYDGDGPIPDAIANAIIDRTKSK